MRELYIIIVTTQCATVYVLGKENCDVYVYGIPIYYATSVTEEKSL